MAASDLRLVVVYDRAVNQNHMVTAARVNGEWLILDNRTMRLVVDSEVPHLTPLAALAGEKPVPATAATPKPVEVPAKVWDTAGLRVAL